MSPRPERPRHEVGSPDEVPEHGWREMDARWICVAYNGVAAATDLGVPPCPRCGAEAHVELVYCDTCLDRMYGLEIEDA